MSICKLVILSQSSKFLQAKFSLRAFFDNFNDWIFLNGQSKKLVEISGKRLVVVFSIYKLSRLQGIDCRFQLLYVECNLLLARIKVYTVSRLSPSPS